MLIGMKHQLGIISSFDRDFSNYHAYLVQSMVLRTHKSLYLKVESQDIIRLNFQLLKSQFSFF